MTDLFDRLKTALAGRYAIECELGAGGMATVYLAEDLKHHRKVAVKVLRPELAATLGPERFVREIEIAAKLSHPHILPLFDSGEADGFLYYVMPYVEGESLRDRLDREGKLSVEHMVRLTDDVAAALSYAHDHGIVHRDVKPENIMLTGGRAVVADFGIARAVTAAGGERLTGTGFAIGTPTYMSPEQAMGLAEVDARSDVYALGCVVYEMVGGRPPFEGPTPQALLAKHAAGAVPGLRTSDPAIPVYVERAVEKALAKDPADRFQTPSAFAEALTTETVVARVRRRRRWPRRTVAVAAGVVLMAAAGWWTSRAFTGGGIESLAVLPFYNVSGDPEQEYLVAGMHEALIGELAQIGALRVISRTSAMRYQNSDKTVPEIARELNVDAVVEASVTTAGTSVSIEVQLIDALPEERHLWSQVYDRNMDDVFVMYSDVARAIARQINVELTPEEETRLTGARRVNRETYEAYLKGMFYLHKSTLEDFQTGLAYLHEAVETNPADPLAYAGLALGYSLIASHGPTPPPDAWARARGAAERALKLDSTLAEAHAALAEIKLYLEWDWAGAEQAFRRALELNPSLASSHAHYAMYLVLFGRDDEAVARMKRAQQVDPLDPLLHSWMGDLHYSLKAYDEMIDDARKALELDPDFPRAFFTLGLGYAGMGMYEEAIAAHEKAVAAHPGWNWALADTYALAGRTGDARRIAAELEGQNDPRNAWGLALVYMDLGEKDEAFRWVEAAYEYRNPWTPWFRFFEPLRDDPRLQDLVRRMNLPPL